MKTQTDYTQEIEILITSWYATVQEKEAANKETVKKSLDSITEDVCNILPSQWVNAQDVHGVLKTLGFKAFPFSDDDNKNVTFLYYLQPK